MLAGKGSGLMACRNALSLDFNSKSTIFERDYILISQMLSSLPENRVKINGKHEPKLVLLHDQRRLHWL